MKTKNYRRNSIAISKRKYKARWAKWIKRKAYEDFSHWSDYPFWVFSERNRELYYSKGFDNYPF